MIRATPAYWNSRNRWPGSAKNCPCPISIPSPNSRLARISSPIASPSTEHILALPATRSGPRQSTHGPPGAHGCRRRQNHPLFRKGRGDFVLTSKLPPPCGEVGERSSPGGGNVLARRQRALFRCFDCRRVVVEDRRKPAFGFGHAPVF